MVKNQTINHSNHKQSINQPNPIPNQLIRDPTPPTNQRTSKLNFKSAKTRFKLSAGLNLETFDTILSGTNSHGLNLNRRSNSLNSATGIKAIKD